MLKAVCDACNFKTFPYEAKLTCPACDSEPGLQPNPPSKFIQDKTNSTAFPTSIASSLPCKSEKQLMHFIYDQARYVQKLQQYQTEDFALVHIMI